MRMLVLVLGLLVASVCWGGEAGKRAVSIVFDTDMSGDCDDAGALGMLHAMADAGECRLLAVVTNRKDRTNASAAAVDAINTFHGRGGLPIGTCKEAPTALRRTSAYAGALRDEFPNDIGPDDQAPDALDILRKTLEAQEDGSVVLCSVGALSNLAELCRKEEALVRRKVKLLVVMGGQFPLSTNPETNIRTHVEASRVVAERWPTPAVWHGWEVGNVVITGSGLKKLPAKHPVRRAYELKGFNGRPAIDGGQPSWDQGAVLYAVHGLEPGLWDVSEPGRVSVDEQGNTKFQAAEGGRDRYVKLRDRRKVEGLIEELMATTPRR